MNIFWDKKNKLLLFPGTCISELFCLACKSWSWWCADHGWLITTKANNGHCLTVCMHWCTHTHTLFNHHTQDLEQFTVFTSCVSSPMILQQYCTPHDAPPYVTCEHKWIKYSHYTHPPQPTWRTHWVHSCVWARGTLCWCSRRTAPALQMCRTWCLSSPAPSCHGQPAPWPRGTFCSIPGQHQSSLVGSLPALCTPWSQCHLGSPPAGMWSWTSVGRLGRTPLFLCRLPRPETHRDRTGYQGHTGWGDEQVAKAIWLGCMTECIFLCKALSSLCLAQSLSLWHQCAKSLSWQLIQVKHGQ